MFYRSCFVRLRVKTKQHASFMTKNSAVSLAIDFFQPAGYGISLPPDGRLTDFLFLYSYRNQMLVPRVSNKERGFLTKAPFIWIFSSFSLPSGVNLLPIVLINLM